MAIVLNLFQGKSPHSSNSVLEVHVLAGLTACGLTRVVPSPLQYARFLLLAGVAIAVLCCLFNSSKLVAQEDQIVDGLELIDDLAHQSGFALSPVTTLSASSCLQKLVLAKAGIQHDKVCPVHR